MYNTWMRHVYAIHYLATGIKKGCRSAKLRVASFTTFRLFIRHTLYQTHSTFLIQKSRSKCLGVAQGVNVFRNILQDALCVLLELEATVNAEISLQSIMGRFLGCCVVLLTFDAISRIFLLKVSTHEGTSPCD